MMRASARVAADVSRRRVELISSSAAHRVPLRAERQQREAQARSPAPVVSSSTPPASGRAAWPSTVMPSRRDQRADRLERGRRCRGCPRRRPPSAPVSCRSSSASQHDAARRRATARRTRKRSPATRTRSTASVAGDRGDLAEHRGGARRAATGPGSSCRRASRRCGGSSCRPPRPATGPRVPGCRRDGVARRSRPRRVDGRVDGRRLRRAGSPTPGTGTRRRAAPGSRAAITNIVPGLAIVARLRCAAGRKPYSGRVASAGSSRPTTRIAEFAMTRRSTSLAVCCAPIRMMPRQRPRSAMSSRISLIGLVPSRGAYLFSSSSTTKSSGRAARCLLLLERAPERDADDEPLRAVGQVVDVDHGDLRVRRRRCGGRGALGTSARTSGPSARCDDSRRRTNALIVPRPVAARPSRPSWSSSRDLVDDERRRARGRSRTRLAVDPPRAVVADRLDRRACSARATLWTTIVYCWRSSSASANTNGSSSSSTELGDRPVVGAARPVVRVATSGTPFGSPARGGANTATDSNGAARQPERAVAVALLVVELARWPGRGRAGPRPSR